MMFSFASGVTQCKLSKVFKWKQMRLLFTTKALILLATKLRQGVNLSEIHTADLTKTKNASSHCDRTNSGTNTSLQVQILVA
jgi:hypothetical protein